MTGSFGESAASAARADLAEIFNAGLARVRGRDAVRAYFAVHSPPPAPLHLVAVGKAAAAMAAGAFDALEPRIENALVITKHGHLDNHLARRPGVRCIESDHPVPGAASLEAGAALLDCLGSWARPGSCFLFLLSGGASSLVEAPADGLTLGGLEQLTRALLENGLDIARMNTVRRAVSRIKGGRLAPYLNGCAALNLLISDVPGDDPGVIGSGLLTPVRETFNAADYPPEVAAALQGVRAVPAPDAAAFAAIETHIIARLSDARRACLQQAATLGHDAADPGDFLDGDAADTARQVCRRLCDGRRGVLVLGGETLMRLPEKPGRGGRNQHLALAAAAAIQGRDDVFLLAAGTDGTDGPTDAAGGLVDGGTIARGESAGLSAADCLARADSGAFLEASGDLIVTGPTGTNVMDLVIGLKLS